MATAAELEIKISANVNNVITGLATLNQQLDKTKVSAQGVVDSTGKTAQALNSIQGSADKAASAYAKQAVASTQIVSANTKIVESSNNIASTFNDIASSAKQSTDVISEGFDKVTASVNQISFKSDQFQPIVEGATRASESIENITNSVTEFNSKIPATSPLTASLAEVSAEAQKVDSSLENAQASATTLQSTLAKFGSIAGIETGAGVFKFDTAGLAAAKQNIASLKADIVSIPPINFKISGDTQTALLQFHGLSQEITNLATGAPASIARINSALATLRGASLNATDTAALLKYSDAIAKLERDLNKIKTSAVGVGVPLKNLGTATNAAGFAVGNFSRILQDLPFGFIGIANNLNPFLESLQAASREAKAAGTSLTKNLLGSLTGSQGIGVALSVVTAALSIASFGISAWTRGFSSAKDVIDEVTKANEDYAKSLENIDHQAVQSSQKEIVNLRILSQVAQDATRSYTERLAAVDKLQQQYPAYFGNLSKEQILYGNITDAVNLTTQALINKGLAEANANKAAEAATRVVDLTEQQEKALTALRIAQDSYNAAVERSKSVANVGLGQDIVSGPLRALNSAKAAVIAIGDQLASANRDQEKFINKSLGFSAVASGVDKVGTALQQTDSIIRSLGDTIDEINHKSILTGVDPKTDKIQAFRKAIEDLSKIPIDTSTIKKLQEEINRLLSGGVSKDSEVIKNIQKQIDALDPASGQIQVLIQKIKDLGGSFEDTGRSAKTNVEEISKTLDDLNTRLHRIDISIVIDEREKPMAKIEAIQKAIEKLDEAGASPSIIIKLQTKIEALSLDAVGNELRKKYADLANFKLPTIEPPAIKIPVTFDLTKESADFFQLKGKVEALSKTLHIDLPVNFEHLNQTELQKLLKQFDEIQKKGKEAFEDVQKNGTEAFQQLNSNITAIISDLTSNMLVSLGEGLGNALGGIGGFGDVFKGIFTQLGEGIKQLGEALIRYGTFALLAKKALASIFENPILAITAGIALEALGSLLLSKIPKFAEGGVVTHPTLALIGERGSEAVIPLDRIQNVLNGTASQQFLMEHRVSGQDLITVLRRADKHNGRTY